MKYANNRMMFRRSGRFAKAPTLEQMGFDINDRERTCEKCGHSWFPVLADGICPKCSTRLKVTELTK